LKQLEQSRGTGKLAGDDSAQLDAVDEGLARCEAVIVPVNTLNESGCPFAN